MVKRREFISLLLKNSLVTLFGLVVNIVVFAITSHDRQPEVVYSTNKVLSYPLAYDDDKFVRGKIPVKVLKDGLVEMLSVEVRVKGESSAEVVVKIPYTPGDKYIGGLMIKSQDPSTVDVLDGRQTEYRFHNLLPGDTISFRLYLRNVNSDLDRRIGVFLGDGYRAAYYPYVSVPDVGRDGVIIAIERRSFYIYGLALGMTLFAGVWLIVWLIRKSKQPAISAEGEGSTDASEDARTKAPNERRGTG